MSKNRNYTFTHNNYVDTSLEDSIECKYIAYSREVAPTTGTPHLQGYIAFNTSVSHRTARRRLPDCHVEVMRGRFDQNEAYCSKAGLLTERGTCPMSNENIGANEISRWEAIWEAAKSGDMMKIPPKPRVQYYSTFKRIKLDYQKKVENLEPKVPCGIWIFGPAGTGKTTTVVNKYPEHYEKMANKWWDDYNGEEVVLLDEFDAHHMKEFGSLLKSWADYKKFRCENKGSSMCIRPKKFIITSNNSLSDVLRTDDPMYPALERRFTFIRKDSLAHDISQFI